MFTVSSSYPFAAFVNAMLGYDQYLSAAAFANQAKVSYAGDPLAGTVIPGSTLAWNAATSVQQFIEQWYEEGGHNRPDNYGEVLAANAGPHQPWNYSYETWASMGILKLA